MANYSNNKNFNYTKSSTDDNYDYNNNSSVNSSFIS